MKAFSHQLEKPISGKNLTNFKFRASNASTVGTDFSCSKSGSKSFASTAGGSHRTNCHNLWKTCSTCKTSIAWFIYMKSIFHCVSEGHNVKHLIYYFEY